MLRGRRSGYSLAAVLLVVVGVARIQAHETDQYTLPAGREFADLGPYFNSFFHGCIERGVDKTNARIREAIEHGRPESEIAILQDRETVIHAVNREFPYAIFYIEKLDQMSTSTQMSRRFPGYLTGHKPPPTVQKLAMFPLNPFRAWGCATMKIYGTCLGSDKIGHFTDMGMHYYQTYRGYLKQGLTEDQAIRKALEVGVSDPLKGESALLGYWTAGDYSNADLVANYAGMLFYRNLTEAQMLEGQLRPPMLMRNGPYWKLAPHVRADSDFFAWFVSDHLDEAMNPGHFLPNMREGMRAEATEHADAILNHRLDDHGNRHSQAWFAKRSRELRTYWGFDYGHRGTDDDLILIDQVCFVPPENPADRDGRGRTALQRAIDCGDEQAAAKLIVAGANVNEQVRSAESYSPEWGNTALHLAARDGRDDVVRQILSHRGQVNARNDRGITPLHLAVSNETTTQLLLDAGAQVDIADAEGRTALHWAVTDAQTPTLALLLARGANANARDRDGRTPLHLAAAAGRAIVVAELVHRGADVNAPDNMHETPLHLAAMLHDGAVAEALLRAGASVASRDDFGRTPLHDASRSGSTQVAALLLDRGAVAGASDLYGGTPLHLAARSGNDQIARLLIGYGADAHARAGSRGTPTDEATRSGFKDLVQVMSDTQQETREARLATHRQVSSSPPANHPGNGSSNGASPR